MTNDIPKPLPDEAAIRKLLHRVIDPEAGLNIVDLGLVYRVAVAPERIVVEMTMTSPACPLGEMITDEVQDILAHALPPNCAAEVRLVWAPPWDQSMMSEAGKQHFGWEGTADG